MYTKYAKLRDERQLTDYRVGKDTGIAPATLSEWKRGGYKPKLDKLQILAEYFGVPLSYFLE